MNQHKQTIYSLSLKVIVMLIAMTTVLSAQSTRIRLQNQAQLTSGPVTLADIAVISSTDPEQKIRLEQMVVTTATRDLNKLILGPFELSHALANAQISPASLNIFGANACHITITDAKPVVEQNTTDPQPLRVQPGTPTIADHVLSRLAASTGLDQSRLVVNWSERELQYVQQPYLPENVQVEPRSHFTLGQIRFAIIENGAMNEQTGIVDTTTKYISAQVQYLCDAVIATRSLKAGEIITREDISIQLRRVSNLDDINTTEYESMIGLEVARPIKALDIIDSDNMLRKILVIKRRDTVDVISQVGMVKISMQAVALEEGAIGDTISLRTPDRRRQLIRARVISPGKVTTIESASVDTEAQMAMSVADAKTRKINNTVIKPIVRGEN